MNHDDDSMETAFAFCKAEISVHSDLGFITFRVFRYENEPGEEVRVVPSLLHRLQALQIEDLIGHLQKALGDLRSETGSDDARSTKH